MTVRIAWLLALSLALPAAERPDIILILVDTVRRDHVGCHGAERPITPRLDALAREGAVLETCIAAASWTLPSVGSIFSGLPPSLHGLTTNESRLDAQVPLLAERLRAAGYQTAAVVANPLARAKHGLGRGFDLYDDYSVALAAEGDPFGDGHGHAARATAPHVTRAAIDWLERRRRPGQPFFLFLLYFDPHADYVPPPPWDRRFADPAYTGRENGRDFVPRASGISDPADRQRIRDLYAGEIGHTDACLGEVVDRLATLGLDRDTLVLAASDHGEEFWDHGGTGHGGTLHRELVEVPAIVRWPGRIRAGTRIGQLVSHVDLNATLAAAAGLSAVAGSHGENALPLLLGHPDATWTRTVAIVETEALGPHLLSARSAGWSLIWDRQKDLWRAFDLTRDPGEQVDVAATADPAIERLRQTLTTYHTGLAQPRRAARVGAPPLPIDPATAERLRALGYLH